MGRGIFAAVLCTFVSFSAYADPAKFLINEIVDHYRAQISERHNREVVVIYYSQDSLQMTVSRDINKIYLSVYFKTLEIAQGQIVFATCHEIGHMLGQVGFDPSAVPSFWFQLEGESDYFAGSCLRDWLIRRGVSQPLERAAKIAQDFFEALYEEEIVYQLANYMQFDGINVEYPAKECRVLTARNGAQDKERPKCWFNP